jgi:hypothetical protein
MHGLDNFTGALHLFFSAQFHHHIQEAKAQGMTSLQSEVIHPVAPYIVRATLVLGKQTFQVHGQQEDLLAAENMAMERVFALAGIAAAEKEGEGAPLWNDSESNVSPIRPVARVELIAQPAEPLESIEPVQPAQTAEPSASDLDFEIPAPEEEFSPVPLPPLDEPGFYAGEVDESADTELPSALHDQLLEQLMEQTTQEIRRIGMNNSQGRTYLKNSYGKASRQELNLSELKSFLIHLKSQPSKK